MCDAPNSSKGGKSGWAEKISSMDGFYQIHSKKGRVEMLYEGVPTDLVVDDRT
jgi:hypothetical protein